MKFVEMTCPHCGAHMQADAELRQVQCNHCGSTLLIDDEVQHVQYDNAEEAGYNFEKGRQRAQAEMVRDYVTANTENTSPAPAKKSRIWLWVLGWIIIFPLPLTIILHRKKNMKPALKYSLIAAAWIVFFLLLYVSNASESDQTTEPPASPTITETTPADSSI